MLIDFHEAVKKYGMKLKGCVQVGCHNSEEHEMLLKEGVTKFIYIEPCQKAFDFLVAKHSGDPNVTLFQFAAGASVFNTTMYTETANNGQSNSILKPKEHLNQHPSIVFTDREEILVMPLDSVSGIAEDCNLLLMDCQCYEKNVLLGATEILKNTDYIFCEINRNEMYEDCPHYTEIVEYLKDFTIVETHWVGGWGDALFLRSTLL